MKRNDLQLPTTQSHSLKSVVILGDLMRKRSQQSHRRLRFLEMTKWGNPLPLGFAAAMMAIFERGSRQDGKVSKEQGS
jgi:hypothetical protein